jgi:N-acylneuraminate cytidylyltransferase
MDDMVKLARLAVIPARGGSKRIPRKNIMDFHGKPMIAWTIEAAVESGLFDRVVVSTDDPAIADVARAYGADVPFFRKGFADDQSPVSLATVATVEQLTQELGESYDVVAQLMANCPIRDAACMAAAVQFFEHRETSSLISCFKFGWMNPWWASRLDADNRPTPVFPEAATARSQDLPPLYCPTGAIWIARAEPLMSVRSFYTEDRVFFPISWEDAVDIDDMEDFHMAEAVYLMRHRARGAHANRDSR